MKEQLKRIEKQHEITLLVTNNLKEFQRVEGLKLENWII
jgi:predicted nucleic acid-binding protein